MIRKTILLLFGFLRTIIMFFKRRRDYNKELVKFVVDYSHDMSEKVDSDTEVKPEEKEGD